MDFFESEISKAMVTYSMSLSLVGAFSDGLTGAVIGALIGAGLGLASEVLYPVEESKK